MRGVGGWHLRSTSLTGDTVTGSCSIGYCVLHILKHRSVAPMKHVFVASADVGAKAAEDSPQVGGEDSPKHRRLASPSTQDSSKAAVGAQAAVGAAESAAEGPSNMDVDGATVSCCSNQ